MASPEEQVATAILRGNPDKPINGDIYDNETGTYLGALTDEEDNIIKEKPFSIDIYIDGYWYTYVPIQRIKHGQEETVKVEA